MPTAAYLTRLKWRLSQRSRTPQRRRPSMRMGTQRPRTRFLRPLPRNSPARRAARQTLRNRRPCRRFGSGYIRLAQISGPTMRDGLRSTHTNELLRSPRRAQRPPRQSLLTQSSSSAMTKCLETPPIVCATCWALGRKRGPTLQTPQQAKVESRAYSCTFPTKP